jgi:hypothetical protein
MPIIHRRVLTMLLSILLAVSLPPRQQASAHCVDTGAETAASQTQPLHGPGGVTAVLKVSTADDHGTNSHDCNAEYQLLFLPAGARAAVVVNLLTSDAEYDRIISLRLDGFSQDGKRVFGVLSEVGKYPATTLFVYSTADGRVQLMDLRKSFAHMMAAKCSTTFDVIGATAAGTIALELSSTEKCSPNSRWVVNPAGGSPQPLPQAASILDLYKSKEGAP